MNTESKDIYYYQPAAIGELSSSLTKAFESMEADGNRYIKSATVNSLLVVSADYNKQEVEDLIYTLTLVHPNRAFLVVVDESCKEIRAEFSTRCHKISKSEHICSEVIRLFCSSSHFAQVKSILRANLMTGMPTELVLIEGRNPVEVYNQFGFLSEQVIFSTALFENNFSEIKTLLQYDPALIDLEWVKLGSWREPVKEAFKNSLAREKLSELRKIELTYSDAKHSALLLTGWMADRLGLDLKSKSGDKFTFKSRENTEILIELISKSEALKGVSNVSFIFGNSNEYVKITRGDLMQTEINFKENVKTSRPFEDLSFAELLKRYFFIGESTINYRDSLSNALKLNS